MEVLDFAVEQLGYGFWISSLLGLVITLLCFLFWSLSQICILMISISRRVSYVILFGGFLAWWGNKGVIKLFSGLCDVCVRK